MSRQDSACEVNINKVRAFINDIWNRGDLEAVDRFLAPGYVDYAYDGGDVAALKAQATELVRILPDRHFDIECIVGNGDTVVAWMVLTGTHRGDFRGVAARGNPVSVTVVRWFNLADGQITAHRALLDTAGMLRQMAA